MKKSCERRTKKWFPRLIVMAKVFIISTLSSAILTGVYGDLINRNEELSAIAAPSNSLQQKSGIWMSFPQGKTTKTIILLAKMFTMLARFKVIVIFCISTECIKTFLFLYFPIFKILVKGTLSQQIFLNYFHRRRTSFFVHFCLWSLFEMSFSNVCRKKFSLYYTNSSHFICPIKTLITFL